MAFVFPAPMPPRNSAEWDGDLTARRPDAEQLAPGSCGRQSGWHRLKLVALKYLDALHGQA